MLIASTVLAAVAISTWWLQRVAFTPSADEGRTHAILADDEIRGEIASVVASATAPVLSQSPPQLREFIEQIARLEAGSALMSGFVSEAHERLIGQRDDPVRIGPAEQVTIVRDERVALEPPITLTVQEVGTLAVIDTLLGWTSIVSGALAVLAFVAGLMLRPERGELTLALGIGLISLAASLVVFGYLVPLAVLPALSDSPWMGVFPRLANDARFVTFGAAVLALALGVLVTLGTASLRQRRQWSTPLAVGRYREQHNWSR